MSTFAYPVTATLRDAEIIDLSGRRLRGKIYDDEKGRFADGEVIITSRITSEHGGNWFGTLNSAYGIASWAPANDNSDHAANINSLVAEIHADNIAAGWWTDLATGASIIDTRNVPEMLCLIHSEISEAMEGHRKDLMDDKLPHRKMMEVELADAVIRIFDLAGSRGYDLGGAIQEKRAYNRNRADHKPENRLKAGGKAF